MTDVARLAARCGAAAGALGLALVAGPAWALDLPSLPPAPAGVPLPLPTGAPSPVASLLPSPVASALDPVLSQLPGGTASPSPSPKTSPKPTPAPAPDRQVARAEAPVLTIPVTQALRADRLDTAQLRAFPGVVAPMAAPPKPVMPQLTPAATTIATAGGPSVPNDEGLPALVVAVAIGTAFAAAAGQVAEMAERRRT